jgi:hypothetical protein
VFSGFCNRAIIMKIAFKKSSTKSTQQQKKTLQFYLQVSQSIYFWWSRKFLYYIKLQNNMTFISKKKVVLQKVILSSIERILSGKIFKYNIQFKIYEQSGQVYPILQSFLTEADALIVQAWQFILCFFFQHRLISFVIV